MTEPMASWPAWSATPVRPKSGRHVLDKCTKISVGEWVSEEKFMSRPARSDQPESKDRRAALSAIGKYAALGVGASVGVLSSADAVKAQANSKACEHNSNAAGCRE